MNDITSHYYMLIISTLAIVAKIMFTMKIAIKHLSMPKNLNEDR